MGGNTETIKKMLRSRPVNPKIKVNKKVKKKPIQEQGSTGKTTTEGRPVSCLTTTRKRRRRASRQIKVTQHSRSGTPSPTLSARWQMPTHNLARKANFLRKGDKHKSPSLASQTAGPSHSRFAIWRPGVAAGGFLVIHTRRRRQASRHAPRVSICRHACEAARARLG